MVVIYIHLLVPAWVCISVYVLILYYYWLLPGSYQWPMHPRCWSWPGECSGWGQTGSGKDEAQAVAGTEPAAPQPWQRSCETQKLLPGRGERREEVRREEGVQKHTCWMRRRMIPCGSSTWRGDWPGSWTCKRDLVGSGRWPRSRAPCMWTAHGCREPSKQEKKLNFCTLIPKKCTPKIPPYFITFSLNLDNMCLIEVIYDLPIRCFPQTFSLEQLCIFWDGMFHSVCKDK